MTERRLATADSTKSLTTRFSRVAGLKPGCWGRREEERHGDALATRCVSKASASISSLIRDYEVRITRMMAVSRVGLAILSFDMVELMGLNVNETLSAR